MNFGEILKELRELKGLKQKEVAEALGITPVAYNRFEKGNRLPDIYKLGEIAKYFDVDMEYFINDNFISNEHSLLKYTMRDYLKISAELNFELTEFDSILEHDKDSQEISLLLNTIKDHYGSLQVEKESLLKLIELEPLNIFMDKLYKQISNKD